MSKYNKAIGTIVGVLIGIALNWIGLSETVDVPVQFQPVVDQVVVLITGVLGTVLAPKNAPS